jgi:hypothetical protein
MRTYKAISLKQPWANLVAEGAKTIETRTWGTRYRGDIVICSSRKPPIRPAGCAIAVAELYDVRPMAKKDEEKACCELYPKAHSWLLRNIRKIDPPIPVRGSLGVFSIRLPSLPS